MQSIEDKKLLYCFGDSHISVFDYMREKEMLLDTSINVCSVPGATALGMVNPNSKTDAFHTIQKKLESISDKEDPTLLFLMGEVDCGFVIWYRAEKYGLSVEEQMRLSLDNYATFLKSVKVNLGFQDIIICTSHLPTIKDGQGWGEVANSRKEVKASLRERTDLTFQYNRGIRQLCSDHHFGLLDIENDVLGDANQIIDAFFLNHDPLDHHLEASKIAPLYVQRLNDLGFL